MRKISFKAGRKGDSVAAVARRYRVSAAQVAQWNGVSSQAHFKAGQTITVEVRAAPAGRVAARGNTTSVRSVPKRPRAAAAGPHKPLVATASHPAR